MMHISPRACVTLICGVKTVSQATQAPRSREERKKTNEHDSDEGPRDEDTSRTTLFEGLSTANEETRTDTASDSDHGEMAGLLREARISAPVLHSLAKRTPYHLLLQHRVLLGLQGIHLSVTVNY